jgi:hypothetical protein
VSGIIVCNVFRIFTPYGQRIPLTQPRNCSKRDTVHVPGLDAMGIFVAVEVEVPDFDF